MAVSKMVLPPFNAFIHKKRKGLWTGILVLMGLPLLLLCNCSLCYLLGGEWEINSPGHTVPLHSAEGYSLYNFAFGCAFSKAIFVNYSIREARKAEVALQYCEDHLILWDRIAALWRQNAVKRTVVGKFRDGETWPQEPPEEPIYILRCPSLGVVIGQDPQTHRVNFTITFEGLRFSELTEWSYPRIQSWEAIQVRVWEPGVPWTELPTDFPKLQQCFMGR